MPAARKCFLFPCALVWLLSWFWSAALWAQAGPISQKIVEFDELTFVNPAAVVREGTALYQSQAQMMTPEEIIGLSVVIAESAGLYGKSETIWEWVQRGEALIAQVNRPVERIRLHSLAGVALEFQGKAKEARAAHEKAIATAVAERNLSMEAYARELFTYFANREADFKSVVENVKRMQEIYQQLPHGLAYYSSRAAVGSFFVSDFYKRYDEGIALLKEAIAYFELHGKTFLAFNYSNSLTGLYASIKPEDAIKLGLELVEKYPDTPDMPYSKYIYDSLGGAYFKLQKYREALRYFRLSAEFWQSNGDNKLYYSELMLNVCKTYIQLKDYDKAFEACERISDFPETASLSNQITWYELRASLARHRGQGPEELRALRQLRDLSKKYHQEQNAELSQKMAAQFEVERIEEQKRQLELKNQARTLELERAERIQRLLILLSVLIFGLLALALLYIRKRNEVLAKHRALRRILDTIKEGIVRIGSGSRILPYYSKATASLLGCDDDLVGQDLLATLLKNSQLPPDQIQIVQECLNTIIGEHEDNWDFNASHLPEQLKIGSRVLSLGWQPTIVQQKVEDITVTIVDISRHLELEEAVRTERLRNTEFHEAISELRRVSMSRALRLLREMQQRIQFMSIDRLWLHTQKGIARSLGLQRLSGEIHQLESWLAHHADAVGCEQVKALEHTLQDYLAVADEIGPREDHEPGQDLLSLCSDIITGLRPKLEQHRIRLEAIRVDDRYQNWDEGRLDRLRDILVHAITNSIDHGFIRSQKQEARLSIEAARVGDEFQLVLRDNGSGLNWQHIRKLARERGLETDDPASLTSLLFEEGVSTTQSVSTLSGRGLGLSAIQEACRKVQGHCSIGDNPEGAGTELRLTWPERSWNLNLPRAS